MTLEEETKEVLAKLENEIHEGVECAYYRYTDDALRINEIAAEVTIRAKDVLNEFIRRNKTNGL